MAVAACRRARSPRPSPTFPIPGPLRSQIALQVPASQFPVLIPRQAALTVPGPAEGESRERGASRSLTYLRFPPLPREPPSRGRWEDAAPDAVYGARQRTCRRSGNPERRQAKASSRGTHQCGRGEWRMGRNGQRECVRESDRPCRRCLIVGERASAPAPARWNFASPLRVYVLTASVSVSATASAAPAISTSSRKRIFRNDDLLSRPLHSRRRMLRFIPCGLTILGLRNSHRRCLKILREMAGVPRGASDGGREVRRLTSDGGIGRRFRPP